MPPIPELLLCGVRWVFSDYDPAMGRILARSEVLHRHGFYLGNSVPVRSSGLDHRRCGTGVYVGVIEPHHSDDLTGNGADHHHVVHVPRERSLSRPHCSDVHRTEIFTLAKLTPPPRARQS